jgi:hypothetical protein
VGSATLRTVLARRQNRLEINAIFLANSIGKYLGEANDVSSEGTPIRKQKPKRLPVGGHKAYFRFAQTSSPIPFHFLYPVKAQQFS